MADYIVTTRDIQPISGFEIVSSVKDLDRLTSKSYLIFESSYDKYYDVAVFLIRTIQSVYVKKVAYITDSPVPLLEELMKAVKAYISPTPDYIDSVENISLLMEELANYESTDNFDDLTEFLSIMDAFVQNNLEKETKATQRQVTTAFRNIINVIDNTVMSDVLRTQLQELVVDFIVNNNKLEEELIRKEKEIENIKASSYGMTQGVSAFQPYTFMGNSRVLVIKEHSPVRYLTSFLIAFVRYMTDTKAIKTKLIIIDRDSDEVEKRYNGILRADYTSVKDSSASLNLNQVVYTTTTSPSIMSVLMSSVGIELYVVLDRAGTKLDLITGRGIKTAHAVSSRSYMRRANLQAHETIVNDSGEHSQLGVISMIERYPKEVEAQLDHQQKAFQANMKALEAFSGIMN